MSEQQGGQPAQGGQSGSSYVPVTAVPPPAVQTVPLTVEEYQRLRGLEGQLTELQKTRQAELDAKEAERIRALAEKGEVEKALKEQQKLWETKHSEATARYASLETQVFQERKAATLKGALAGREYAGDTPEAKAFTANMVAKLLDDDFETRRDASGALMVVEKSTGRPADAVLRERLDSPSFAIFFAPSNRGGSGSQGGTAASQAANGNAPAPGSVDAVAEDFRKRQGAMQSFGLKGTRG